MKFSKFLKIENMMYVAAEVRSAHLPRRSPRLHRRHLPRGGAARGPRQPSGGGPLKEWIEKMKCRMKFFTNSEI